LDNSFDDTAVAIQGFKSQYLNNMCEMLDSVCDVNREDYFLTDLNIDWFSSSCPLKRELLSETSACNLVQVINQPNQAVYKHYRNKNIHMYRSNVSLTL
jgi:hypothetical protein